MVDKFGQGRVFVAGGKEIVYLSVSPAYIERPQMQRSMCIICSLQPYLTSILSVHSPTGGQGLNSSVQDAVGVLNGVLSLTKSDIA